MFTDFQNHVSGVPQIAPKAYRAAARGAIRSTRTTSRATSCFRGRVRTRTSAGKRSPATRRTATSSAPHRCATSRMLQPAFFHNGSFTRLEDALRYHLNTLRLARVYDPAAAGIDADLRVRRGPIDPVSRAPRPRHRRARRAAPEPPGVPGPGGVPAPRSAGSRRAAREPLQDDSAKACRAARLALRGVPRRDSRIERVGCISFAGCRPRERLRCRPAREVASPLSS